MMNKNNFHYFTKNDVNNFSGAKDVVDNMIKIIDQYIIPNMNEANIDYNHSRVVLTFKDMVVTLIKESTGRGTPQELKFKIENKDKNVSMGFKTIGKGREGQDRDKWDVGMAIKWSQVHHSAKEIVSKKPDYTKMINWMNSIIE